MSLNNNNSKKKSALKPQKTIALYCPLRFRKHWTFLSTTIKGKLTIQAPTSTRWRLEARLRRTKANSPICASDIPTYKMKLSKASFNFLNKNVISK